MISLGYPLWPVAMAEGRTFDGEFIILCYDNYNIILTPVDWLIAWAEGIVKMEPMIVGTLEGSTATISHVSQAISFCSSAGIF